MKSNDLIEIKSATLSGTPTPIILLHTHVQNEEKGGFLEIAIPWLNKIFEELVMFPVL